MTARPQFQLFPPARTQPNPSSGGIPPRKTPKRQSIKSPDVSPVQEDKSPSNQTETVILKIIEDTNIISPPAVHMDDSSKMAQAQAPAGGPPPNNSDGIATAAAAAAPRSVSSSKPTGRSSARNFSQPTARSPPPTREERKETTTTSTNSTVPSQPTQSMQSAGSPTIPMKSIFPRYDPNKPLNQQNYYPQQQRPPDVPKEFISRSDYSPSLTSPCEFKKAKRLSRNEHSQQNLASTEELIQLWETTNTGSSDADLGTLHLCLSR